MIWWEYVMVLVLIIVGMGLIAPQNATQFVGVVMFAFGLILGTQRAIEELE